jgi:hypothetical protein
MDTDCAYRQWPPSIKLGAIVYATIVAATLLFAESPIAAQAKSSPHQQHQAPGKQNAQGGAVLETPASIAGEHRELHGMLVRAGKEPGELGVAARALEKVLGPHFKREEEIATPPLGLLRALAQGHATPEMRAVVAMTRALERELPQMLREHEDIRNALARLRAAAKRANRPDYVSFADALSAHARQEEEILYPAAVIIGRYVALVTREP